MPSDILSYHSKFFQKLLLDEDSKSFRIALSWMPQETTAGAQAVWLIFPFHLKEISMITGEEAYQV